MRILFLQKVDNARGGVTNVNINLMSYFLSLNCDVDLVSIRHGDSWEEVIYPKGVNVHLVNSEDIWGCPLLREIVGFAKRGRLIKAMQTFLARMAYKKRMNKDYQACQVLIENMSPDVIINSHYEVLAGVSDAYLKRTIMHFHTSFDQVRQNSSYAKIFEKYVSKIHGFVWLSEKTKENAIAYGLQNSRCIYNPLAFSEERCADPDNQKVLFIGRMSEEKRVHLAVEYFKNVTKGHGLADWVLEIYGDGELSESIQDLTKDCSHVRYMGRTENVREVLLSGSLMLLTSSFEGMPLAILEANECGVPVLAYDFGESSSEVIQNGQTGVIVPQDNQELFEGELLKLLNDEMYRRELGLRAKEFAKKFAMQSIGSQWLKLFEEMDNRRNV